LPETGGFESHSRGLAGRAVQPSAVVRSSQERPFGTGAYYRGYHGTSPYYGTGYYGGTSPYYASY
jgi:hypothetical protein